MSREQREAVRALAERMVTGLIEQHPAHIEEIRTGFEDAVRNFNEGES